MTERKRFDWTWLGYLCWAVFVNACNVWLMTPLVQDYGILGVVAVFIIVIVWLLCLPGSRRKRWVTFTLFSLLLGQGLSAVAMDALTMRIVIGIIMCIALIVLAALFARVKLLRLCCTAVLLVIVNLLVPFSQWPFFTHFWVTDNGTLTDGNGDFSALPFSTVETPTGQVVFTVEEVAETKADFLSTAGNAVQSTSSLENLLASYGHRYKLVELKMSGGHVELTQPNLNDLARVDPTTLNPMFPYSEAHWSVENGNIIEYFSPVVDPTQQTAIGMDAANLAGESMQTAAYTAQQERENWATVLQQLGVTPAAPTLQIANGVLSGTAAGHSIHVDVNANRIVGFGSFTAPGQQQLLVEGVNTLQVISLAGTGSILSTYHGPANHPLSSDLFVGSIDTSGQNVVFVNGSPAGILQAQAGGTWKQLYTAPNQSLRFETSVRFPGDSEPEIITDDPSLMQPSDTRYFTSYTYRNGNLIRNWRVYRTDVVNVHAIHFTNDGVPYILAGIEGTGQFTLLRRQDAPVVPTASILLALVVAAGWFWRWRERGQAAKGGEADA